MQHDLPKWPHIEAIAVKLGIKPEARRKWRERGAVPHRWRLPILQEGAGTITASDFSPAPERAPEKAQ